MTVLAILLKHSITRHFNYSTFQRSLSVQDAVIFPNHHHILFMNLQLQTIDYKTKTGSQKILRSSLPTV